MDNIEVNHIKEFISETGVQILYQGDCFIIKENEIPVSFCRTQEEVYAFVLGYRYFKIRSNN